MTSEKSTMQTSSSSSTSNFSVCECLHAATNNNNAANNPDETTHPNNESQNSSPTNLSLSMQTAQQCLNFKQVHMKTIIKFYEKSFILFKSLESRHPCNEKSLYTDYIHAIMARLIKLKPRKRISSYEKKGQEDVDLRWCSIKII